MFSKSLSSSIKHIGKTYVSMGLPLRPTGVVWAASLRSLSCLGAPSLRPLAKFFPLISQPARPLRIPQASERSGLVSAGRSELPCPHKLGWRNLRVAPARSAPQERSKSKDSPILLLGFALTGSLGAERPKVAPLPGVRKTSPAESMFLLRCSCVFQSFRSTFPRSAALAEATGMRSAPRLRKTSRKKAAGFLQVPLKGAARSMKKCRPVLRQSH